MQRRSRDGNAVVREADTEEVHIVRDLVSTPEANVSEEECEHFGTLEVKDARLDTDAGVLSTRLRGRIELQASDCFCISDVRLRLRLRFRYHGHERAEHVVPFIAEFDEQSTYRETDTGVGKVINVETERWDLSCREVTIFEHQEVLVENGRQHYWFLAQEQFCLDIDWPLPLPAHRPETAAMVLSPLLYYRISRAPSCSHDHLHGLGDFYVKPRRVQRVAWI